MTADPAIARVDAGADTVHWGYFDARLSPLLTIESGDRVTISTVSGSPEVLPPPPFEIPAALLAIHAAKGPQIFRISAKRPGGVRRKADRCCK